MFPVHTADTPSDMKDSGVGPGLAPNDPVYSQMYPTIRKHFIEDGLYLNRHYAASVCTPSRKQLLSGRGVWSQNNGDWLPIRPRYSLISDKLKQVGYTNHFVGKWCAFLKHTHNYHVHLLATLRVRPFVQARGRHLSPKLASEPRIRYF